MFAPDAPLSQHVHVFTNLEVVQNPFLWTFMEASLNRHNCLDPWLLVIEFNLQPQSPPQKSGDGTRSSTTLITGLAPLGTSPHPQVLSRSHFTNITKDTRWFLSLRKFQGFQVISARKEFEDQIHVSYYKSRHHNQFCQFMKLNMYLPYDLTIPFIDIYLRKMKTCSHGNLCTNIYSISINNCQKLKTTQMSFSG